MSENETNPPSRDTAPAAFERAWMDKLAEPERDLAKSEDDFVASVLARHEQSNTLSAVVGRIGFGRRRLSYAAAAVLALAGVVAGFVMNDTEDGTPREHNIAIVPDSAQPDNDTPQPGDGSAVTPVDSRKISLGSLIARTQTTMTRPPTSMTAAVRDTPRALRVERLLELIDNPVPDLKELLAPLRSEDDPQSRA